MYEQFLLQLMLSKGIGDIAIKKIIRHVSNSTYDTFESLCQNPQNLLSIIRCKDGMFENIESNKERAKILCAELKKQEVAILIETDPLYPSQLKSVLGDDCPPVLFIKGNINLLSMSSVGFCGSRKVSEKGIVITEQCAEQLSEKGITVVSGYAAGTDLAAHSAAMAHNGNTVFVLAEGILKTTEKKAIRGLLTPNNHVFISQFLPQALWNVGNAMKRNSLIIGLSRAMILVESGKTGGTFAAGEETLKRAQPLFVIDYAKPEVSAEANPYFIGQGGQPIRGRNGVPNLDGVFTAINAGNKKPNNFEQLTINWN